MSAFVLVPGFWLGAWAWDTVAEPLRAAGHTVRPVTLTGLAERAAEGGPQVDLETHVADLTRLVTEEDLREVVLVAHSGGMGAVTGAADRVPERVRRVVYLDSGPLPNGATLAELNPGAVRQPVVDGWRLPMPTFEELAEAGASLAGLGPAERAHMRERATDQPAGTLHQPLRLTGAADRLPKTLVSCSFPLDQVRTLIAAGHPWFASLGGPEWDLLELPTGHWPMFSRPDATARVLAEVAAG
ncbi:alpha/beta fold hydrolase [Streptacidiphilus melanogenes]|uniref:alpha/beta fold hydrolase n=1 Tax=Streptacidiphilus melanogenes TaxID=411235 RepID=UPI0005AB1DC5|nr:alpha/beta hydrolase [Streptacidiphilus melanogenes]